MARSRSGSVVKAVARSLSIPVVSSRDEQHAGRCPVRRRCTGVINSCTSRQTVYAVGSGGVVKAHPEWPSTADNKQTSKTKRPGTFRCPGLCKRELGRYAPTRNLHPVAPDPRLFQRAGWLRLSWNTRGSGADSVGSTACRRNHRTPRRARAIGPRRVECWRGSMRCSRWFLSQKLPLSAVRGWKKGTAWAANEDNCK